MSVPSNRSRSRSRARRRTYLPADARRAQILDVARAVFAQRGYRVANVADICRAARIGRGTLYLYFDNKQAVLRAVMEDVAERVARVLEARPTLQKLAPGRVGPDEVVAFCRARLRELLDAVFADETTLRLVLREARGLDGSVDELIAAIDARVIRALEEDLRAAYAGGYLRDVDIKLTARYLLGGVEKMVLTALAFDEAIDLDAIVRVAVDLELFGLLRQPRDKEGRK